MLLTILVVDVLALTSCVQWTNAKAETSDFTDTSDHRVSFHATDVEDGTQKPTNIIVSRVRHGENFNLEIWVRDMTRMKDLFFNITWKGRYQPYDGGPGPWFPNGSDLYQYMPLFLYERLTINSEVFPASLRKVLINNHQDVDPATGVGWAALSIDMRMIDPRYPLINGTFKVCDITFKVEDPWFCGRQPCYSFDETLVTDFARTYFVFYQGWFSVVCGEIQAIYFGTLYGDAGYWNGTCWTGYPGKALYYSLDEPYYSIRAMGRYTFDPIPGDLDLSGQVDIGDVMIISSYYGRPVDTYPNMYYDLDKSGIIDVFDIVAVTKNFGRTEP